MNNKLKLINDKHQIGEDNKFVRGEFKLKSVDAFGNTIFEQKGSNKVIIAGSSFIASKLFNMSRAVALPSYNVALGLDDTEDVSKVDEELVVLFAMGTDGCGANSSQIYDVDYTKWIAKENLIPFKYVNDGTELDPESALKYFGKKSNVNASGKTAYYFKAFEATPTMRMQYIDGTSIDNMIYSSNNKMKAETVVEIELRIDYTDGREFFTATTGLAGSVVNTISLLSAWKKQVGGKTVYQNIQPLTKFNFQNESLSDTSKSLEIVYSLYF